MGDQNDVISVEVNNVLTEKKISNVFGVIKGIVDSGQTQLARLGELQLKEESVNEFPLLLQIDIWLSGPRGTPGVQVLPQRLSAPASSSNWHVPSLK